MRNYKVNSNTNLVNIKYSKPYTVNCCVPSSQAIQTPIIIDSYCLLNNQLINSFVVNYDNH